MIPADHPSLPGHFPGRPLVPGVVLLDRVLDAIEARDGVLPAALRLPQVKFLRPLLPGEPARIELEGEAPRWRFRVLRDDGLVASGEVVAGHAADGEGA
jgi:3-hydroxyacyl-[acyl-carrier-protein] dehydratase